MRVLNPPVVSLTGAGDGAEGAGGGPGGAAARFAANYWGYVFGWGEN